MLTIYSSLSFFSFHFFSSSSSSLSNSTAMEPKLPNEEIFQMFVHTYLMEKGYKRTAEIFQTETQITQPVPREPPGFLYQFWNAFYNSSARLQLEETFRQTQVMAQQPSNSSTQSQQAIVQQPSSSSTQSQVLVKQPLDITHLMNTTTAQMIWNQTPIQHHSSLGSGGHGAHGKKPFIPYMETGYPVTTQDTHTPSVDRTVQLWDSTTVHDSLRHRGTDNVDQCGPSRIPDNQDAVNSVLSKFRDLNVTQKDQVMVSILDEVKDLEKQVEERKEWALRKALQAGKRLTDDMTELRMLRMEREETQNNLEKLKKEVEDITMKKLLEMESTLIEGSGQVDRANEAVRRLEAENAEIRAEIEASKLSASESETACLEVAKKEKKWSKKLRAWEKQKAKLQEEVSNMKEKISEAQEVLAQTLQRQEEAEVKWKEELKAQEDAVTLVEEEHRAKETAESNKKREFEDLRLKINVDFQRHKEDIRRLEHDLSCLKASVRSNTSPISDLEGPEPQRESIDNLEDLSEKEANNNRECIICMKDEVSVVFLPCAHQVMCAKCSDEYGKEGKASCPCCQVEIQQRIRVFGASS